MVGAFVRADQEEMRGERPQREPQPLDERRHKRSVQRTSMTRYPDSGSQSIFPLIVDVAVDVPVVVTDWARMGGTMTRRRAETAALNTAAPWRRPAPTVLLLYEPGLILHGTVQQGKRCVEDLSFV